MRAQTGLLNPRTAEFLSHEGTVAYLTLGVLLPLARDGGQGRFRSLRTLDALGTSVLLCEGLKRLTHEERPDGSSADSFPSGHATAAFAIASMAARHHPKEAVLWYLGAFLIADSRVTLKRHYSHDVVTGALLGIGTAAWERSRPRGLLIAPFVRPGWDSGGGRSIQAGLYATF